MLLMIDNYDSFTYNLVQYFYELGEDVKVIKNDQCDMQEIAAMQPTRIVISPGPCTPAQAGISNNVIGEFASSIPILGVCLGHQSIGAIFGADVVRARKVMHGKTSQIFHRGQGVFQGLSQPFTATRYHSLVISKESLPDVLEITAWTEDENNEMDEIMAVRHRHYPVEGVQFHPESILSENGHTLLQNFLNR
ncbi:anthranilate synthase component II [Agarilytica rhodophyticola]|uniref:anthranilate synthase component II n=1 Tax=Agarilytica rhodophyticola TaxID=1737490 RepID=UPI000B3463EA|nr:aminodeoxychorismate/anthranilate synthase component II [Agarilytica rhodophyticola]